MSLSPTEAVILKSDDVQEAIEYMTDEYPLTESYENCCRGKAPTGSWKDRFKAYSNMIYYELTHWPANTTYDLRPRKLAVARWELKRLWKIANPKPSDPDAPSAILPEDPDYEYFSYSEREIEDDPRDTPPTPSLNKPTQKPAAVSASAPVVPASEESAPKTRTTGRKLIDSLSQASTPSPAKSKQQDIKDKESKEKKTKEKDAQKKEDTKKDTKQTGAEQKGTKKPVVPKKPRQPQGPRPRNDFASGRAQPAPAPVPGPAPAPVPIPAPTPAPTRASSAANANPPLAINTATPHEQPQQEPKESVNVTTAPTTNAPGTDTVQNQTKPVQSERKKSSTTAVVKAEQKEDDELEHLRQQLKAAEEEERRLIEKQRQKEIQTLKRKLEEVNARNTKRRKQLEEDADEKVKSEA